MVWFKKIDKNNPLRSPLYSGYVRFSSSIYGRVVFIISIASFFLFLSFAVIFRSVNEEYMKSVISENGNNIGSLVEGALYRSMLENDRASLQSTLDIINTMPGIDPRWRSFVNCALFSKSTGHRQGLARGFRMPQLRCLVALFFTILQRFYS